MQQELHLRRACRSLLSIAARSTIRVVADDSSSMNAVADASNPTKPTTRWQELRDTLHARARAHAAPRGEHVDGFKLKFLNDRDWLTVDSADALSRAFAAQGARAACTRRCSRTCARSGGGGRQALERSPTSDRALAQTLTDGRPSDGSM